MCKWHVFRLSVDNMWTCVKMDLQKDKRSIWAVLRFAVPGTLKHQESASTVKQDSRVANYVSWGPINPCSRQMYMTYPTQEAAECRCLFAHPICSSATEFLAYVIRARAGLGPWEASAAWICFCRSSYLHFVELGSASQYSHLPAMWHGWHLLFGWPEPAEPQLCHIWTHNLPICFLG